MGNNYPDVTPGQSVQHSARRENAISHLLKDANKFLEGRAKAHSPQSVRVPAYNASGDTILPGEAVQIDVTGNMSGPAFPVVAFDEDETDAPFGVFDRAVAENGMADLIVSGPATVQISGSSGSYAVPTDGGGFERGDEGFLILHISGETEGVVLLGNYYGKIGKVYVGGLGITVTPGEEDDDPDTISANLAPGTDISITPVVVEGATTGQLQISYTGIGGGLGFPDIIALSGGTASDSLGEITDEEYEPPEEEEEEEDTPSIDAVIGISYLVPVRADVPIKYNVSADVLVRFARFDGAGDGHFYADLPNGLEWTPYFDGYLRISVLDDGTHSGDCIRLYVGTQEVTEALPLYRCGYFQQLTGDGETIQVQNGTISYIGSGGGDGGWIPNWGTYNHTAVVLPNASTAYTAGQAGELWACAYFDPFKDGFRYRHYSAHVSVNGACFKVCELKLGDDDLYLKIPNSLLGTTQYDRDTDEDYTNRITVSLWDPKQSKQVTLTYTRHYGADEQDPNNVNYYYFGWYCYSAPHYEHVDEYDENEEYDYRTLYTHNVWHVKGTEDVYLKKLDSNDDPYFDDFGYGSPVPEYTHFAWKYVDNNNTSHYVYTQRSDNTIKPVTSVYEPDGRGQFEAISGSTISQTNMGDISAVGVGAGTPIRFRKNASISFVVTADGYSYYVAPASSSIPSAFCVVYEQPAPAEEED